MKKTDYLVILSTDTAEGAAISKADIITKHTALPREGGFGWNRPGIDYLVTPDGSLQTIILEASPADVDLWGVRQGQKPINGSVKYLAYAGGKTPKLTKDKDTRTDAQKDTLAAVVKFYVKRFPHVRVLGFNQIPAKQGQVNPAFDVPQWLTAIGIAEKNIFKDL
ncbi:MAG: N-acetylmuramoyl-L-alanine amidase [Sinomicrobium sp.]|nr:N-acetylmuramoyl-L-alanine amidase [Sinomicrobium sp.]